MAPLPGSPTPNAPGTGSMSAPSTPPTPSPMAQSPQGARTPTGLAYGQAQALQQAQKAVPVAGGSTPPPGAAGPGGGGGQIAPDHPAVLQAAQGWSPPISPLTRPTDRPFEPVTAGLKNGPGPGPEVMNQPPANTGNTSNLSALLARIAQQSGSPAVATLAQNAAAAGQ